MAAELNPEIVSQFDVDGNVPESAEEVTHHCGIYGLFMANPGTDYRAVTFKTMQALQPRGQEGAGVHAIRRDGSIIEVKGAGLVANVLNGDNLAKLQADDVVMEVGQARYSTSGDPDAWQPYQRDGVVFAHNGNFTNPKNILATLPPGLQKEAQSDSWIVHQAIVQEYSRIGDLEEAIRRVLSKAEGAYSLIIAGEGKLYAIRDPKGVRPLSIGRLSDGSIIVASETTALVQAGAKVVKDVKAGQGIVIDEDGPRTFFLDQRTDENRLGQCLFELIYFASSDSVVFGEHVAEKRRELGRQMARKDASAGFLPDIIVPIQHSGILATEGYAEEMMRILLDHPEQFGLTLQEAIKRAPMLQSRTGLIVSRYAMREFIMPDGVRQLIADAKQRADAYTLEGKKVVMIDDTIVRGDSAKPIAKSIRRAAELLSLEGPASIHLRAASAQILYECYLGVDIPDRRRLIAVRLSRDNEAIARELGFDSVNYLDVREMLQAIAGNLDFSNLTDEEAFQLAGYCGGCFIGKYPMRIDPAKLFAKTESVQPPIKAASGPRHRNRIAVAS